MSLSGVREREREEAGVGRRVEEGERNM